MQFYTVHIFAWLVGTGMGAVEVPLSNLTGKLSVNGKKGENPSRKTTPSPAFRKHSLADACQRNDPGGFITGYASRRGVTEFARRSVGSWL